jgi:sugar O-acyltransferase (sialic acid O-acetyltransferase NeuD family)
MKNLIIIGARSYGREVYNLATQCKAYNTEWTIKGFLDDKASALDGFNYPVQVLAPVEKYEIQEGDVFICALGDVKAKMKYINYIIERGGEFTNLIHPNAQVVNLNTRLGKGIIIFAFCIVSNEVTIEDFVTLQAYCVIGHDTIIGEGSMLNVFSAISGAVNIGKMVTIYPGSTILPNVIVGDNTTVGAGSIVIKNVKAGITVFGNPAKELKF